MKKLILLELALLFLATTFQSDNPPGWYQQQLPVNDFINDIFFLDSLNGWVVTQGNYNANDTSYILRTLNGGNNWIIQEKNRENLNAVQFLDYNTGYAVGGTNGTTLMSIYKTNNGGTNWIAINNLTGVQLLDLFFINNDTGWVCDDNPLNGGLYKTTNGGGSWVRQLDQTYSPKKLFFLNENTGWTINDSKLYKTINSGINWDLEYTFSFTLRNLFFLNNDTGWIIKSGVNGILKTKNGGLNWQNQIDPDPTGSGLADLFFVTAKTGYIATGFSKIIKTIDGINWGKQNAPTGGYGTINFADSLNGWSGGFNTGIPIIIHTDDGGGPIVNINQFDEEISMNYKLFQNYPNPFNPVTVISYQLAVSSNVQLKVFDLQGKQVTELVNRRESPGEYEASFNGDGLTSGVYFYKIEILDEKSNKSFTDTKKMVLVR